MCLSTPCRVGGKGKALLSAVICINCPQEDIYSKPIHFVMGKGSEPGRLSAGSNPRHLSCIVPFLCVRVCVSHIHKFTTARVFRSIVKSSVNSFTKMIVLVAGQLKQIIQEVFIILKRFQHFTVILNKKRQEKCISF